MNTHQQTQRRSNTENDPGNEDHDHKHDGKGCCSGNKAQPKPMDIFQAVKSGYLMRVQELLELEGPSIFTEQDDKGHTPVHWACLGGLANIVRIMVQCKVPLDTQSKNDLGARPIHWACVNGHIAVVDILLQAGVNIDTVDNKGCSPLIIACQYGQTQLSGYLMGKGARLQLTDREGDNALHWAAFKGFCELTRLLIYSGFNPRQKDNYGQTPLHLACINGDLNTVKMLCEQDGVEVDLEDHNHKTPLLLAKGRNHTEIMGYLDKETKNIKSVIPRIDLKTIMFGPPGNSKAPFLFFVISVLFWGYPMYVIRCFPATFASYPGLHMVFIANNVFMWFTFYQAYTKDPGFLPRNSPEYDQAIRQVAQFDEWKQGQNPLSRLCHTCRLVKPYRTKHCRTCNRCVLHFDHHCPYIYNCVGLKNRTYFMGFTTSVSTMMIMVVYFAAILLRNEGWNWLYLIGIIEAVFFGIIATGLCSIGWYMAVVNINTNERINFKRYNYLKDASGNYHNPYDKGILRNLDDFFRGKNHMTDEEVDQSRIYVV
ncbi:uncharacterized protein LOC129261337 [Lytechinus pictus]|uniref:uncharacterized protein LOC129261337 n=1 Tax=Lytechinus pictus TaxID=7653 RepID=UPI0030B9DB1B